MNPAIVKDRRVLVLEPDDQLANAIEEALHEINPDIVVDRTRSLEEAQKVVLETHPQLFVLDLDASADLAQEFLYDLRTSHPNARAIILTAVHLAAARERTAGLGAIHLLEKPFPHGDFVDLVQALLQPEQSADAEKFQGTLSDLHIADIIQLKCMSGATAGIELTGPNGEKGRVYFERGQVRHATAGGREGLEAFNQIMTWKGGRISEVSPDLSKRTIDLEWQVLVMEAARKLDEERAGSKARQARQKPSGHRRVLVIDDSLMLLSFVKDILSEANYEAAAAPNAQEGLAAAKSFSPDLILLDYVLPDMKGDEITKKLRQDPATANVPVVYMSAIGVDLKFVPATHPNVIGFLNKPFTSDLLIKTVENHMPKSSDQSDVAADSQPTADQGVSEPTTAEAQQIAPAEPGEWWSSPQRESDVQPIWQEREEPFSSTGAKATSPHGAEATAGHQINLPDESVTGEAYFCGDTRFFSLNWALQTIGDSKLTGTLRSFWARE